MLKHARINRAVLKPIVGIIAICCLSLFTLGLNQQDLMYNHNNFQYWQLISAHFTHYDYQHFGLNMLALMVLYYLFPLPISSYIKAILIAILLIDVFLLMSPVKFYAGYSGLLYVLPGFSCAQHLVKGNYQQVLLILSVLVLYSLYSIDEEYLSNDIMWQPLIQAHILGFIAGFITRMWRVNLYFRTVS